jgi:putative oxidoreductase
MNIAVTAARLPGGGNAFSMILTAGSIGVEVGIATLFLFGIFARQTAIILILYTIAAMLMFHDFWAAPEAQVVTQTINFCKNLGLIGGLLLIVAFGAGRYAIRPRRIRSSSPRRRPSTK